MNALSSALAGRPASATTASKPQAAAEPAVAFGQLLKGLSTDTAQTQNKDALEELPVKELTARIEQLSGMPAEQLTEEQYAVQYAVFQLLADSDGLQLQQAIEAYSSEEDEQAELAALVKQIKSLLLTAKEFVQPAGFSGVAEKEIDVTEASPEVALRPLIELAARLKEETHPSEKMLLLKELTPFETEVRLPFAQMPAAWLHALSKEGNQTDNAIQQQQQQQQPEMNKLKAVPAESELSPEAEPVDTATPVKTEGLAQTVALPAGLAEQKSVDVPVRQVPVQKLSDTLAEWISSPARLSAGGNETRLRINIFPEHLGHLEILVSTTGGKVSAQIIASHGAAKEAVEFQLNQLRISLSQQGIEIDRLEVRQDRSSPEFQQHERQRESAFSNAPEDKLSRRSAGGESVSDDADMPVKQTHEAVSTNGQVNYTV